MDSITLLFSPIKIGTLTLNNRVIMPAMHLGMSENSLIKDALIDFYEERAKASPGPGLIIVGGCSVEPRGKASPHMVSLEEDRVIPPLRKLNDRLHRHGVATGAQLYHAGRYAFSGIIGEKPVSASELPSRLTREKPRALSTDEIVEVETFFADAARRAVEAGFDMVELIVSAGYLFNQFLSPITNERTDRYGGDLDSRMNFLLETIAMVRKAVGPSVPVGCRLSGSDFMEGGHGLEEAGTVAAAMENAGVDLINVTGGWHETRVPQITMNVERGAFVYLGRGIKEKVKKVPVAVANRINDPWLAEDILRSGDVDMVAMGRAFIADPQVLEKARSGNREAVRRCIACNQGCFDRIFSLMPIACLVNPRAGEEGKPVSGPAEHPRKVLVVGGGPAGMTAAWTAARRGHKVVLCEKSTVLGGQLILAGSPPGREEFHEMTRWLVNEVENAGVEVRLGVQASAEYIAKENPDAMVLATGAVEVDLDIEGIDGENVVSAWDLLSGAVSAPSGSSVVVAGGGATGVEVALHLAAAGCDVTVIEQQSRIGTDIGYSTRWVMMQEIRGSGVKLKKGAVIKRIALDGVEIESNGDTRRISADKVVLALGSQPNSRLAREIEEAGLAERMGIYHAGDCCRIGRAIDAVRTGYRAGNAIE